MAVLRAAQLWAATIYPTSLTRPTPRKDLDVPAEDEPETRVGPVTVYTCPAGHKAIVRTMMTAFNAMFNMDLSPSYKLMLTTAGGSSLYIRWKWWMDLRWGGGTVTWVKLPYLEDQWNGQLVLNAGDSLKVENNADVAIQQAGSGHLLPVP